MHFKVKKNDILPAIKAVVQAIDPHIPAHLQILTGLKLEAVDKKLTVSGIDLNISMVHTMPAKIKAPGFIVVPADTILESIKKSGKEVAIKTEEKIVLVKTQHSWAKINGYSSRLELMAHLGSQRKKI
jgi:DNA polymerase III sliding clamp (beta) subunit (PCNA family)